MQKYKNTYLIDFLSSPTSTLRRNNIVCHNARGKYKKKIQCAHTINNRNTFVIKLLHIQINYNRITGIDRRLFIIHKQ